MPIRCRCQTVGSTRDPPATILHHIADFGRRKTERPSCRLAELGLIVDGWVTTSVSLSSVREGPPSRSLWERLSVFGWRLPSAPGGLRWTLPSHEWQWQEASMWEAEPLD